MAVTPDFSDVRGFDARDLAVMTVDAEHGYTIEFSSAPDSHAIAYDERTERIAAWLTDAGDRLHVITTPALRRHGQPVEILGVGADDVASVRCLDGSDILMHLGHLRPVS